MFIIGTPESNDCNKRIAVHFVVQNSHYSFVEECKRLCEYQDREISELKGIVSTRIMKERLS